ncbi:MAG: tRNA uridine-5-carboxymethylaminomethyl(34) synthesis enzyme MnmG, partial [Solirubrobacter sp.]|nr:tRNA uridine-5-carboxymethylaminomethyl(34) synthesis enzyme MnmG [Solirubrobacter sp.]
MRDNAFDVIVIGAGHAGCEAALAASRMGARTLLLTISLDTMAWMPCNSSIGGPGRGQLVREIDALGGEMARLADRTTLHSRRSNIAKGPAVQSPFTIVDRRQYQLLMKYLLEQTDNLHVRQALIKKIQPNGETLEVTSVFSETFEAKAVVLAAGTFMRGEVVYGDVVEQAGRYSEIAAPEISRNLEAMGFAMGRFKTGTSPRVSAASVDTSEMEIQEPDERTEPFSFWTEQFAPYNLVCYKTRTTEATRGTVLAHLQQSRLFKDGSRPIGTRYCPSIEDKVLHGADRPGHPVFLQPQAADGAELYIQGLSTSLPPAAQEELVRSVPGLEHARIMRPGYAVMYDYVSPEQLLPSLET